MQEKIGKLRGERETKLEPECHNRHTLFSLGLHRREFLDQGCLAHAAIRLCLNELLQPRVLSLGLFRDGDVGVGLFPEGDQMPSRIVQVAPSR